MTFIRSSVRLSPSGSTLLVPALMAAALLIPRPWGARAAAERPVEDLIAEFRSHDAFRREQAEGEIRRRGSDALAPLAAGIEDPDSGLRLRIWRIFRDLLRLNLEDLDTEAGGLFRDRATQQSLRDALTALPRTIEELRRFVNAKREPIADHEKERQAAAEVAEKAQRLRALEEALRDAAARLPDIEARLPDRVQRVEAGRKRLFALGPAVFGPLTARREASLPEIRLHCDELLAGLRASLAEERMLPPFESKRAPDEQFERSRYVLSTVWAREIDQGGPLADKVRPFLEEHVRRTMQDLRSGDTLLRERAEEDLYALGQRGLTALAAQTAQAAPPAQTTRPAGLAPGQFDRLASLLRWRIEPRLAEELGIDFRGYETLPFRARRRMVIHYARVAGRAAVPTLHLIAFDDAREPSWQVRIAAAQALAGPPIRDLSAIRELRKKFLPEMMKVPEIARDFAIISGIQLMEEKRYAEAVEEFRKVLDEAPYDFQANYRIAFVYLLMKDYAKSILHFEIARRVQPGDDLTLYNLACAYSLDGQIEKALETLAEAVKSGFADSQHMEADPDLAPLRTHPRFHEILDRLRRGSAKN